MTASQMDVYIGNVRKAMNTARRILKAAEAGDRFSDTMIALQDDLQRSADRAELQMDEILMDEYEAGEREALA